MATSFSATLTAALSWAFTNPLDQSTPRDAAALALTLAELTNGTGANQANTIWHDRRTLASAASDTIDLYDFGGGTPSPLGTVIANAAIKFIYIKNRSATATDVLTIGNDSTTAAWNSFFNASDTNAITLRGGASLLIAAPDASGYAVADTTNHLLKILNSGAGSVDYDIVVIGATA